LVVEVRLEETTWSPAGFVRFPHQLLLHVSMSRNILISPTHLLHQVDFVELLKQYGNLVLLSEANAASLLLSGRLACATSVCGGENASTLA
jgi:hypothetical protein